MSVQHVTIPYQPRPSFLPFHNRPQRWAVVVAHRRSGKTVASVNELIKGALTCQRQSPRFAYLAPFRQQAKIIAWDYVKRYTAPIPGRVISEGELHVKLPRDARVTLYGADNYDALRGIYLDGAVIDEPADMAPEVWTEILRPALADRKGWAAWVGTPKGRNAFFRLYDRATSDPEYFTMVLPASESHILDPDELASARKAMDEASYQREFECSFDAPVPGAIYAEEIAKIRALGQIRDQALDRAHPLYTFWDLGQSDYTCIWLVQLVGRDIIVMDYYSGTGKNPAHYANHVAEWELKYDCPVRLNYLPHDAQNKDRAGKTWVDDLKEAGMKYIKIVPRTPDIWLGINHLRTLISRFFIHKTNCSKPFGSGFEEQPSGLDCLEYYSKKETNEGQTLSEQPVHNEFSHGCLPGESLVMLESGLTPIDRVATGDRVKIGEGFANVLWAGLVKYAPTLVFELSDGSFIECTAEHKIFTTSGVLSADTICMGQQVVLSSHPCFNHLLESPIGAREGFSDYIEASSIGSGLSADSTLPRSATRLVYCIRKFGQTTTALFRRTMSFIRSMALSNSTNWKSGRSSIVNGERLSACGSTSALFTRKVISPIFDQIPSTNSIQEEPSTGLSGSITKGQSPQSGTSTTRTITPRTTRLRIWKSWLRRTIYGCTAKQTHGLEVLKTSDKLQSRPDCLVSVVKVSHQPNSIPVYDLTIEKHGCYSANGVMVSNSDALRTFAEAQRLGMIEGTSFVARENRDRPIRVLRGPGPDAFVHSNPARRTPNVLR